MKQLTVLVLAGGSGSRFWPFSTDKIVFPFHKQSLFEYSVARVIPSQATQLIIVTNQANHDVFSNYTFSVPHQVILQPQAKGMADAIVQAKSLIGDSSLLLLISDDLFDPTLPSEVVGAAMNSDAFGVLPGWKTEKYFPGGYLELDVNRVLSVKEKPGVGNEPSEYVTISGHFIRDAQKLITTIESIKAGTDDVYEQALSQLMKQERFLMHPYHGKFASLKYPWQVIDCMNLLLAEIVPTRGENITIADHVIIEGPVIIGNNVKIMEFSKIVGPCIIGDNTIVGNNNVIRHSLIGSNCVTGFSTDITRSYIGNDCWFHSNYVGDSVIEQNVSMGSGTVLANLRLDEGTISSEVKGEKISTWRTKLGAMIGSNVRIGVNVSTMPGVKIGAGSFITAATSVAKDVPNNSFVRTTSKVVIESNAKEITTDRETYRTKI